MIALDTNVLVRYFVRDDVKQADLARKLLEALTAERPGFVCREVLVELVWVLERSYRVSKEEIANLLLEMLATDALVVEAGTDVIAAALRYREGAAGFSDLMISAAARRAEALALYTLDRNAARLDGVELLV